MIKLITPPGMLVTVALLTIYSVYAFLIGSIEKSSVILAGGFVSIVATYGTAMLRPWSRHLVYLLTAGFISKWLYSISYAAAAGYFNFTSRLQIAQALTPGLLLVLLSFACSYVVFRQFRRSPPQIDGIAANESKAGIA